MKDKIRVGLCGLGSFSFVVANTVQRSKKVERVTCFDPLPEKREVTSKRYSIAQAQSDEAMVRRDDLDGVLIVSPNTFHREQTELAAWHGKYVYVEKPIANTMDDGRRMIAARDQTNVTLIRSGADRVSSRRSDAGRNRQIRGLRVDRQQAGNRWAGFTQGVVADSCRDCFGEVGSTGRGGKAVAVLVAA